MNVLVIGAGGHGCVVAEALEAGGAGASVVGFLDDDASLHGGRVLGRAVLGGLDQIGAVPHDAVALGVGDNAARARIFADLRGRDERIVTVAHPKAWVSPSASLGAGAVVIAGAVINACAAVGENAIVNTGATVDHHCVIEPHAHIAPGAHIAGGCRVGSGTLIGAGAVVAPRCAIGEYSVIGAGSVVVRDLPDRVVAYGNPARVARHLDGRDGVHG